MKQYRITWMIDGETMITAPSAKEAEAIFDHRGPTLRDIKRSDLTRHETHCPDGAIRYDGEEVGHQLPSGGMP